MIGRPTKYTEDTVDKVNSYVDNAEVPFVEELALSLGLDDDTIVEWAKIHPSFSAAIKRLKQKQKLSLLKGSLYGQLNTVASIFQLKVNHNMVEAQTNLNINTDVQLNDSDKQAIADALKQLGS